MMSRHTNLLAIVFTSLFIGAGSADETGETAVDSLVQSAGESNLSEFVWEKRPILVFADSENDPAFIEQMALIAERQDALIERDVVVLTDTQPDPLSPVRKKFRPRGFMLVVLNKEGRVQMRKPFPWDVREISRSIDKLPIRQKELRDAKGGS